MDWERRNVVAFLLEQLRWVPFTGHLVDQLEAAIFGGHDGGILTEDVPPGDASGVIWFGDVIEPGPSEPGRRRAGHQ